MMRNDVRTYIHIAHALARAYMDLFYVNMDTGEYIEFHTEEEYGVLTEARRGSDFSRAASVKQSCTCIRMTRLPLFRP